MIYLHIGVHKTGSSSIQKCLGQNIDFLKEQGFDFFQGILRNPNNHTELHMATMRYERDSFGRYGYNDLICDGDFTERVRDNVQNFLKRSTCRHQIFTNEGLSWIRYPDEIERLKRLFYGYEDQLEIIIYLRDREDFKRSYKNQIKHKLKRQFSQNVDSVLYIEDDSWVFNHDDCLRLFKDAFSKTNVTCLSYDEEMENTSNIIPSFLLELGIDGNRLTFPNIVPRHQLVEV